MASFCKTILVEASSPVACQTRPPVTRQHRLGASLVGMATARRARRGRIGRHPSRSRAPFDLLPRCAREKGRTRETMRLCRLIDGIEEAGIARQIGPYRSTGVKEQWHYGEGGAFY